jgi:hypothetical protein
MTCEVSVEIGFIVANHEIPRNVRLNTCMECWFLRICVPKASSISFIICTDRQVQIELSSQGGGDGYGEVA